MKINEIPLETRPREKALRLGINQLNDQELLALIIGSGVRGFSALDIAGELLKTNCYSLEYLSNNNLESLLKYKGLKKNNALKLLASFTLHKRLIMPSNQKSIILSSPRDVYIRYKFLEEYSQEVLVVLLLDNKFRLKKEKVLYQGTSNSFSIKVDEVLKELVLGEAKAFILIHNHPDQTKEPSNHDVIATKTIEKSAKNLSIKLLDHLIIYKGGYYSFKMNK